MVELTLEPYSAVQHWSLSDPNIRCEDILAAYLQTLAQRLYIPGQSVIGHIKALALFSQEGFLSMSVVAPDHPATIKGEIPPGCTELELTLNILVYGMKHSSIEKIDQETARDVSERWQVRITD